MIVFMSVNDFRPATGGLRFSNLKWESLPPEDPEILSHCDSHMIVLILKLLEASGDFKPG